MSQQNLSRSAQQVQDVLRSLGVDCAVVEMPAATRSAQEAADTIGSQLSQIAKSLIFVTKTSRTGVLVIASGTNRVEETKVASLIGEPIERATAEFVREQTGFVIGGVPPVGHAKAMPVILDEDLQIHHEIWAAAGTPFSVFRITPAALKQITGGIWADVKR